VRQFVRDLGVPTAARRTAKHTHLHTCIHAYI
jgi:hypothetical protein